MCNEAFRCSPSYAVARSLLPTVVRPRLRHGVRSFRSATGFRIGPYQHSKICSHSHSTRRNDEAWDHYINGFWETLNAHHEWTHFRRFRNVLVSLHTSGQPDAIPNAALSKWPDHSMQALRRRGITKQGDYYREQARLKAKNDALEYQGEVMPVCGHWSMAPKLHSQGDLISRPWLEFMRSQGFASPLDRLTVEMRAFEAYMRPTNAEKSAARYLHKIIGHAFGPNYITQIIGSRRSGLATPCSDLDLVLFSKNPTQWLGRNAKRHARGRDAVRQHKSRFLNFASAKLQTWSAGENAKNSSTWDVPRAIHGKVRLVRIRHLPTDLEVQLQAGVNLEVQHELVDSYLEGLPSLRPIYILLRHATRVRGLAETMEGGIGSYPLLMMIVAALKSYDLSTAGDELGSHLLHVLRHWSQATTYQTGYTVDPSTAFPKYSKNLDRDLASLNEAQVKCLKSLQRHDAMQPYLMCLQDPADYRNDLGKKAYSIKHIQKTFGHCLAEMNHLISMATETRADMVGQMPSILAPLVEANYTHFETRRALMQMHMHMKPNSNESGNDTDSSTKLAGEVRRRLVGRAQRYNGTKRVIPNKPTM